MFGHDLVGVRERRLRWVSVSAGARRRSVSAARATAELRLRARPGVQSGASVDVVSGISPADGTACVPIRRRAYRGAGIADT